MAKFILIDEDNRVKYVEDTRPNTASGPDYIEITNDSVQEGWYYNSSDSSVVQTKPLTIEEVREMRNQLLIDSDWMVLEDSPYREAGQESNLIAIETYRQALRDHPNPSFSYNLDNLNFPELTLS